MRPALLLGLLDGLQQDKLLCLAEGGTDAGVVAVDLHCVDRMELRTSVCERVSDETDGKQAVRPAFMGYWANRAK